MLKKIHNISIAYKIYIPLIFIIIIGLSIIIINFSLALDSIETRAKLDIKKELQSYIRQELSKNYQVALSNAINVSLNPKIIDALKNNDRELAYKTLNNLGSIFKNSTILDQIKIHIHDKNAISLARSWSANDYGDDIGEFRQSLNLIKRDKQAVLAVETGRLGMMIRGVAPVLDGDEFIGSIEIIQGFDKLVVDSKKSNNYSIAVFNCEDNNSAVKKFKEEKVLKGRGMVLSQDFDITDKLFYATLEKEFDKDLIMKHELVQLGEYYVAGFKLRDMNKKRIGCILIAADKEHVNRYVEDAKKIFKEQIGIMLFIDILMLMFLVYIVSLAVKNPIFKLLKNLKQINQEINHGKTPLEIYENSKLQYDSHDEIGSISQRINILLKTMSKTFVQLQKSQKHTSEYIKAIYAGGLVSISDINGDITYVNDELCKVSGYTRTELIGNAHSIFRDAETPKRTYEKLWQRIQSGKIYNNILKNKKKDGSIFYTNVTIIPIKNEKDEIIEYIAFRDDVTELINSKKELKRTSSIDALTNLGNRFKMISDISEDCYLAILDIDCFKEVNDFYGYEIGDLVLKDLAKRLFEYFNAANMEVYHLNGDEFAVLANNNALQQSNFYELIRKFIALNSMYEFFLNDNTQINVRLTCGISFDGKNLINYADIAHKHAKKINKDLLEYTNEINIDEEYKKNLEWTSELKKAIDEDRIKAYYQPIVNTKTLKIEKYEALMRLIKKDGEVVSPAYFLQTAKKTRIYKDLTKIIVTQAFEKFSDSEYELSINLSIEDIMTYDVSSWIFDLAKKKNIQNRLVIELVESEGIESFEEIAQFIKQAKENGIKIAIDDFGTGYSNFEYLFKLNADYLKIDGSLISEIDKNEKLCSVVEVIVAFAKKNDIKVIGEFVSTKKIFEKTQFLDINYAQGYYLGMPSDELQ
ncbi:EAL domain-containing protein [bacterium]|nr:EAL domain-containing protein [bacterium]MBU1995343.1 EAL domain-containing protein [bacterium]